jgi:Gamma-glutamyl cyclotransferase, AIG2-like
VAVNLFAYGTLMAPEGLREALGTRADALAFRPARLPGWRRIWNVHRAEWGGGILNLEPSSGDVVVGMLIEGLEEEDLARLDAQEATHLPRETVYVEPFVGEVVQAQIYRRRRGNHAGKPSGRYRTVVLERAYRAGWEVYENLCRGSVDAAGNPLTFG